MPTGHVTLNSVTRVSLPGSLGRVGVLPRHAPMIFKLKSGVVSVYGNKNVDQYYFVWGGIAYAEREHVKITTEAFTLLDDLDPMVLSQKLKTYQSDLVVASVEQEKNKLSYKIAITEAMLHAVKEHQRNRP